MKTKHTRLPLIALITLSGCSAENQKTGERDWKEIAEEMRLNEQREAQWIEKTINAQEDQTP
jgi:uncharacterized protein YceK